MRVMNLDRDDILELERHHDALCYITEEIPEGQMELQRASVEPHMRMYFASTATWKMQLKMIKNLRGRPGLPPVTSNIHLLGEVEV